MKFFSGIGKAGFRLIPLMFRYWWVVLTLLVFLPAIITSIEHGVKTGDMKEPMKDLGTLLVSSDGVIHEKLKDLEFEIEFDGGIWNLLTAYLSFSWFILNNFWRELWMMIFVFMAFYKGFVFIGGEGVKGIRGVFLALSAMAFVQIMVQGMPFKGSWALIKFVFQEAL